MANHQRTRAELKQDLREQYEALLASSASYDAGNRWEAKRLATAIYNLVHDGGRQTRSILTQLGVRDILPLLSSVKPPDKPGTFTMSIANGMCAVGSGPEGQIYVPVLAHAFNKRQIRFKEWWGETIYENTRGQEITRMNLVSSLRSKDGGSHVDAVIPDSAYLGLRSGKETPVICIPGNRSSFNLSEAIPIQLGHLAIMRQISYEMITSLENYVQSSGGQVSK